MGLLQKLFGRGKEQAAQEEVVEEVKPAFQSNLYLGMEVEIWNKEGLSVLAGRIGEMDAETISLCRMPGVISMPVLEKSSAVVMKGYGRDMSPVNINAVVKVSNRIDCILTNLEVIEHDENRHEYRLPLNNIQAYLHTVDDTHLKRPIECEIINISTGGACVSSQTVFSENDLVVLKAKLMEDGKEFLFNGEIIRVVTGRHESTFEYGILFAELTENEHSSLTAAMFKIQSEARKSQKMYELQHQHN